MILCTPRLLLRPWRPEDLEPFAALNADPVVMRHFPGPLDLAATRAAMARYQRHHAQHGFGLWAVERPGVAPFIGCIGIFHTTLEAPFTPCVEIGWRLARAHWGLGLAPEGARAVLAHAFGRLGLEAVVAYAAARNHPSRRVMEKLGMVRDLDGDFLHPWLTPDHPLARCVLYRARPGPGRG